MLYPEVRVSVNGVDIFIDFGDGSCFPPNAAERTVARKALMEAIELLDKPAMDEICERDGKIGEQLKPKPEKARLRLVR
ncbi:hypothetical protein FPV16_25720 [Methylobacterium sp. W2]|uniref:hypothetical protein n=1 Tax=Methylobacterium sp. W2 TaxID=2598107 RepID=UPI001D0C02CE|nr:hypothetical protein [Methylobacterium sp. W2]MCC0809553.1 hypothetical protein [Methylobacterium sp. W2]